MRKESEIFGLIILAIAIVGFIAMAADADGKRACKMKMIEQGYPVADIVTLCGK